ncbi:MAG: transposase [Bryobacteraceae bacterium]
MSRIARIVLTGVPYHITQRGNGRQQVFFDDGDYRLYIDLLRENAAKAGFVVWGYCLMPNHVHLIGVPAQETSFSRALGRTHADFARHFNLRSGVAATSGKRGSIPARSTALICGGPWRTWNATPSAPAWFPRPVCTGGPAPTHT